MCTKHIAQCNSHIHFQSLSFKLLNLSQSDKKRNNMNKNLLLNLNSFLTVLKKMLLLKKLFQKRWFLKRKSHQNKRFHLRSCLKKLRWKIKSKNQLKIYMSKNISQNKSLSLNHPFKCPL